MGTGLTWDDPIVFSGVDATPTFTADAAGWYILRWEGPYDRDAQLRLEASDNGAGGYAYGAAYRLPPADPSSDASVVGTIRVTGGNYGAWDDGANPLYFRAYLSAPGDWTLTFHVYDAPTYTRPWVWEAPEDLDPLIGSSTSYSHPFDGAGYDDYFYERDYVLTPPAGVTVTILPNTPAGDTYGEVYVQTDEPYDGAYVGEFYDGGPSDLEPFVWEADGSTLHIVMTPANETDSGTLNISYGGGEPPPPYVVSNDVIADAIAIALDADDSLTYDNTGATSTDTLPDFITSATRDIWYAAPALASQRLIRFDLTPSDADAARQPVLRAWVQRSDGKFVAATYGLQGAATIVRIPAGQAVRLQLSFPAGNQALWETAGTMSWTDITSTLPADSDPATPSTALLAAGTTLAMPNLGSLPAERYVQIVGDGHPVNVYISSEDGSPLPSTTYAEVYVDGVYKATVTKRSTSDPDVYTQVGATPGQVVAIKYVSQDGDSVTTGLGVSTDADRVVTDWHSTEPAPLDPEFWEYHGVDDGSVLVTAPLYTTYEKYGSAYRRTPHTGAMDTSPYAVLQVEAMNQMLASVPLKVPDPAHQAPDERYGNDVSWGINGYLLEDPNDDASVLSVECRMTFMAVSFAPAFDASGRLRLPEPGQALYGYDKWAPLTGFNWDLYRSQLVPALSGLAYGSGITRPQIIQLLESGALGVEWSEEVGEVPFRPTVRIRTTGVGANAAVSNPSVGSENRPLLPVTPFPAPARLAYQWVGSSEGSADGWASGPAVGGGQTVQQAFPQPALGWGLGAEATRDEATSAHPDSFYMVFVDGETLTTRTPLSGQDIFNASVTYGYLLGTFWNLGGTASVTLELELVFPAAFRVSSYNARFGPTDAPPFGQVLDPNPNLGGNGLGVDVAFS